MYDDNTSVDMDFSESVQDDAAQAQEESTTAFSDLLNGSEPEEQNSQDGEQAGGNDEDANLSGGIRGRLMASERKGYTRGQQEAEARWQQERAQYEERLSRLEELEIKQDAQTLAQQEKISVALAERLIRAERGKPAAAVQETQQSQQQERPRDAQGRFVSQQQSRQTQQDARVQELYQQTRNIQRMTGMDLLSVFNSDEEIQRRIGSGEIDFYDLAREMQQGSTKKRVPPVVPRTSGNTAHANGVMDLSDAQFDRLDRALEEGTVYDMRR